MTMKRVVITGGAGFIGSNLAERLLRQHDVRVRIFDNMSRAGVERNIGWLREKANGARLEVMKGDTRNAQEVRAALRDADEVFHLAAQVAVTTSMDDPATDMMVNVLGTLNVLEAARSNGRRPFVLFTSTNKVYGALDSLSVRAEKTRYAAERVGFRGVTEDEPLDFHSPYGCSKGAADQYVHDYARVYGMDTVVFRMSCIAGPRQFGNEDQGWVAHFLYSVLAGNRITVCGDGLQVRDVLHVYDLVDAMMAARENRERTCGEVFNLGGGMERAVSVKEILLQCERRAGKPARLDFAPTRPGDQPLYIADTSKLQALTGWAPRRSVEDILEAIEMFWHEELRPRSVRRSVAGQRAILAGELA